MQNQSWQALTNQGIAAIQEERYQDALVLLQHAERKAPGVREVRFWLANACRMTGNQERAKTIFQDLLLENPGDFDAAFGLGYLLLSAGQSNQAAGVLLSLSRHAELNTEQLLQVTGFMRDCNQPEAAIEVCVKARDAEPERADLHFKLARLCQFTGDFERAYESLQKALDLDPSTGPAWTLLAQQKRFSSREDDDFKRLQRAVDMSLGAEADMCVAFAYGKALDDLGDQKQAWVQYTKGNQLNAMVSSWDPKAWSNFVRTRTTSLAHPSPSRGSRKGLPVFIIGMPRSGTTLLEQMLDRHPCIHGRGETNLLPWAAEQLGQSSNYSAATKREAGDRIWAQLRQHGAENDVYLDKNPLNFRYLNLLFQLLPNAKILHVSRDGRDSALSCYFQLFEHADMAFSNNLEHLVEFYAGYRSLMAYWQKIWPRRIHQVNYHELVADSARVLSGVLEFLGQDWNDVVTQTGQTKSVVRSASVWQARQQTHSESIARWQMYYDMAPAFFNQLAEIDGA